MAKMDPDLELAWQLHQRGVPPLDRRDLEIPDEWLSLLARLHGQPTPDDARD